MTTAFFPSKYELLSYSDTTAKAQSSMRCCAVILSAKVSSFKEARKLFRLCYKMNYISDDEFLLLYTSYESQNLELPYDSFSEFDFEKVLATTNVWHCLDFKKCTYCNIRCSRGSVCDKEKALCLLLKRTCFPCR